ncbi:tol-pal system protein YbgF [Candidatus Persebacteraceae bacterium Df01]|jgi:tol-pal system protein YbgF|uniref:Tol-pal system protein YbgF n=1 Tax=Candidatus Doriopsillibacter californiensis TaxID=2970740 RepID=A0ABT7QJM2_9GAMM|nr:tol-pal system protein YbgF [Candidatus Persebacteraceae bacterium Df01]
MKKRGPKTDVLAFVTTTNKHHFFFFNVAATLLAATFLSSPAQAQIFNDNVARKQAVENGKQIESLLGVVRSLDTQVKNIRTQLVSISKKQQDTEQRLRSLSGEIEELRATNDGESVNTLKIRSQQLSVDQEQLSGRTNALEAQLAKITQQFQEISQYVDIPEEKELYAAAFNAFQEENYEKAVRGFQRMLQYYPDGQFNANAGYWMGQAFMSLGKYQEAVNTARDTIALHGDSDKVPDAMLTLARALRNLSEKEQSVQVLEQLIDSHPTTLAADKARQLLVQ